MNAKFVVSSVNIRIWKSTYLERQEGQAHIHGELLQCGVLYAASQAAYISRIVRKALGDLQNTWEDEVCKWLQLAHDRSYTMEIPAPMFGAGGTLAVISAASAFEGRLALRGSSRESPDRSFPLHDSAWETFEQWMPSYLLKIQPPIGWGGVLPICSMAGLQEYIEELCHCRGWFLSRRQDAAESEI